MSTASIVAFVPDLMDRSRLGSPPNVTFIRELPDLTAPAAGTVLLVDLSRVPDVSSLSSLVSAGWRVVAFGSHVERDLLANAASAGVEVLTRSAFFSDPWAVLPSE
jgi:hypothetical protein